MWTDAVQCVMLVGSGIILFFVCLVQIPGGWGAMVEASLERFHLYAPPDDPIAPFLGCIFMTFGFSLFFSATNQVMIQRVLGARSIRDGFLGVIFANRGVQPIPEFLSERTAAGHDRIARLRPNDS